MLAHCGILPPMPACLVGGAVVAVGGGKGEMFMIQEALTYAGSYRYASSSTGSTKCIQRIISWGMDVNRKFMKLLHMIFKSSICEPVIIDVHIVSFCSSNWCCVVGNTFDVPSTPAGHALSANRSARTWNSLNSGNCLNILFVLYFSVESLFGYLQETILLAEI